MSNKSKNASTYSREDSSLFRGIGVLFLLLHHMLYATYPFTLRLLKPYPIVLPRFVALGKICVYIFLFLSGYGLYCSYGKRLKDTSSPIKETFKFEAIHFLKFYQMFWIIYLIFVPLGVYFDRAPMTLYNHSIWHLLIDFLGVSHIFGTRTALPTWWYNGVLLLYYALMPLVYMILKKSPKWISLLVLVLAIAASSLLPGNTRIQTFVVYAIPFLLGMYGAHFNVMVLMRSFLAGSTGKRIARFFLYAILLAVFAYIRVKFLMKIVLPHRYDWIPLLLLAFLADEYFPKNLGFSHFLQTLGAHSGNIYLFHAFIYSLYFTPFVYSLEYAPFVYVFGLLLFLAISILLEKVKELIGYNRVFKKWTDRISSL